MVDEKGVATANVTFTAVLSRVGGRIVGTSDAHGEWKIIGMAHGEWDNAFDKPGYSTSRAKVVLEPELPRIPPLTIKFKVGQIGAGRRRCSVSYEAALSSARRSTSATTEISLGD